MAAAWLVRRKCSGVSNISQSAHANGIGSGAYGARALCNTKRVIRALPYCFEERFDVAIITPRRDLYCASMGAPAHAQQPYPIKTIRMIVPFAPDGIGQH